MEMVIIFTKKQTYFDRKSRQIQKEDLVITIDSSGETRKANDFKAKVTQKECKRFIVKEDDFRTEETREKLIGRSYRPSFRVNVFLNVAQNEPINLSCEKAIINISNLE
jgi:hypothetical protein